MPVKLRQPKQRRAAFSAEALQLFRALEATPASLRENDEFRARDRELHRLLDLDAERVCSIAVCFRPDPRSSERDRLGRPGCVLLRADAENLWRRRAEEIGAGWKTGSEDGGAGGRSQLRRHLRLVISLPVSSSVSAKINVADGEGRGVSARRGPGRKATALARSNRRMGQDTLSAFCAVIHTKARP